MAPRLRVLDHDVRTECANLNLRLHYPTIRQAQAMVEPFIDAVGDYIAHFCLPRTEIEQVYSKQVSLSSFDFHAEITRLNQRALNLFRKASAEANRNGEAGELILFILTEWMLEAPQLIAKMSLKTNSEMPVHGADGVHVKFVPETGRLILYSGEAKLYKDVHKAISSAVASIADALSYDKMKHELELVQRNIQFSGLTSAARDTLLRYLDPFDEQSIDRFDVVTCLIGFDFEGYSMLPEHGDDANQVFLQLAAKNLAEIGPSMAAALKNASLGASHVELFLLPMPSVQKLRDRFQSRIGWTK